MADQVSKRLRTLRKFTAVLEQVVGLDANGGDVPMEGRVHRGRSEFGVSAEDALPMLAILEAPRPDEFAVYAGNARAISFDLKLLVQGFAPDDKKHPADPAYELMARVEQILTRTYALDGKGDPVFPEDFRLGRTVSDVFVGPGVVRPPDNKVSATAFFFIPVALKTTFNPSNPYAD